MKRHEWLGSEADGPHGPVRPKGPGRELRAMPGRLRAVLVGPRATYWRLQISGWLVFGVVNAAVAVWMAPLSLIKGLGQGVALGVFGLGLSDLLDRWIRQRRLATRPLSVRICATFSLSLLLGTSAGVITSLAGIASWQAADLQIEPRLRGIAVFAIHALNWTLWLLFWSGISFSLRSLRERARAQLRESELARALQLAQLRLLKAQLNPHFLFNALNTVRALIAENPPRAQEAVTQLARTLRYTLNSGQDELVTLERELAIVDDYLAIETLRLGERLKVAREIEPATRKQRIPVMLLQMLVENAVKHGIAELPQGGLLRIDSRLEAGTLELSVENARPQSPPPGGGPDSIGMHNSAERLRLLFGPRATLDLDLTQLDRALARVRIPCTP